MHDSKNLCFQLETQIDGITVRQSSAAVLAVMEGQYLGAIISQSGQFMSIYEHQGEYYASFSGPLHNSMHKLLAIFADTDFCDAIISTERPGEYFSPGDDVIRSRHVRRGK